MVSPGPLINTRKGSGIMPGEAKGPIGKNPFRIDNMLDHFPDRPLAFGISMVDLFVGNAFQQFPELPGILFQGCADLLFLNAVKIGLVEFGDDEFGFWDHNFLLESCKSTQKNKPGQPARLNFIYRGITPSRFGQSFTL
jgi:hypothetical protein